ncbi:GNAT family N-acetyltransferase [Fibrella sp. WM1]|uniref:GNAT family N-acetyltransferase n=1 Tax=Fibrella musci TaxID=3242485 RepID=UPI00352281D1
MKTMLNTLHITCPDVHLREHTEEDLFSLHSVLSDPTVMRFAAIEQSKSIEDTQYHLERMISEAQNPDRQNFYLAAGLGKANHIGIGGLSITRKNQTGGIAEIGYYLKEKYWHRGYATQIAQGLINFGFKNLGIHKVVASCSVNNMASVKVLQKCNMKLESVVRADRYEGGAWVDSLSFSILKDEWLDMHA